MKKKLLEKIIIIVKNNTHLKWYTRQSCLALTHLSQGLATPILIVVPPMILPLLPFFVVATTYWNGTCDMLTSAKLSVGYLVVWIIRELNKEPSLHCSSIYINTIWSMLQQCVYLISYYLSTMLLPQGYHTMSICPDIILFNLRHHVCTMCTP